ncbi:hypothetical protein, partial [Klebsiella pneumoniae]|uniref:hypothetical protein n=1 Tax=Klebsiella pneumoniae TaxID=573 RepID=UPI003853E5F6
DRLSRTLRNISGRGRLTEDNIKDTLREVRIGGLCAAEGRHEHFPIHMRTHLIENLKQPVIQSDDHAY